MNILKSGGTLFLAYEGRMGRATVTCDPSPCKIFFMKNIFVQAKNCKPPGLEAPSTALDPPP